jgi:hypothetical protein
MNELCRIEYNNDTGPGDDAFVEWWDVIIEGDLRVRCFSLKDAQTLVEIVNLAKRFKDLQSATQGIFEGKPPFDFADHVKDLGRPWEKGQG